MRQDGEPTIEEILESIKRVIAREDRGEWLARQRAEPALHEPSLHEPILHESARHEPMDHQLLGQAAHHDDVLDLAQHGYHAQHDVTGAPALVAEGTSASMRGSLDALAASVQPPPAQTQSGAASGLEPFVRELLRPALSDWLDRNLPAIVERMVAAEIARIARERR